MLKVDRIVDFAFLATCLVAIAVMTSNVGSSRPSETSRQDAGFQVGDGVTSLVPADYEQRETTYLLLVNSGCKFCTAAMPFYRRLRDELDRCPSKAIKFVSRETPEVSRAYIAAHGLAGVPTVDVSLQILKGTRYPTILAIDRSGRVVGKWQGALPPSAEQDVLASAACSRQNAIP